MSSKRNTPADSLLAFECNQIAQNPEFKLLMAAKAKFILPATIFFMLYYLALPVLVGYAPELMKTPILGPLNLAYLFALSQFFMAWIVAFLYIRAAARFDQMAKAALSQISRSGNKL